MRSKGFRLVLFLIGGWLAATANSAVAPAQGKRVAMVIGNSAYQHTSPLTNPRHDAADVAAVLKGLDFHVVVGFDLGKTEMEGPAHRLGTGRAGRWPRA
jgi:Caspase domain